MQPVLFSHREIPPPLPSVRSRYFGMIGAGYIKKRDVMLKGKRLLPIPTLHEQKRYMCDYIYCATDGRYN